MSKFANIEQISRALNDMAKNNSFFDKDPVKIDREANYFVNSFANENELKAHTVTPSRWWFESKEGMFEDGEIELQPMVEHAKQELHPNAKHKKIEFVAVNVKDAKLTNHSSR